MAKKIKSTKMLKRERVVPFDGEENFVVPKQGGFGQPDNEHYVMVQRGDANFSYLTAPLVDNTPPITTTPTSTPTGLESGTTTSTSSPTQTQTTTTTTTAPTPAPTTQVLPTPPTPTITPTSETLPPEKTQEQIDCESKGGTWGKGGCMLPALPTFPDWSTMDCTALQSEITNLKSYMATARFANSTIADAYNSALATAQSTYTTKCPIPSTNVNVSVTTPLPTPTPTIVGGGGVFGGGGGGGIGEPPTEETPPPTEEAPKTSGKTWLVLLAIVGGLYFLTRKRS